MKAILEFDLNEPDDRKHHKMCVDAVDLYCFIWDVEQEIFRPHRKHGYSGGLDAKRLNELIEAHPEVDEALDILERMYWELKSGKFEYE